MSKKLDEILECGLAFAAVFWLGYALVGIKLKGLYGYMEVPYLPPKNHNISVLIAVIFFTIVYLSLSHHTVPKKIVFSGLITLFANDFRDLWWNAAYIISVRALPQYVYVTFFTLIGINAGLIYLLYRLNKDFDIFGKKTRWVWSGYLFTLSFAVLVIMGLKGFFFSYANYLYNGGPDPHGELWTLWLVLSFLSFVPLLKLEIIERWISSKLLTGGL